MSGVAPSKDTLGLRNCTAVPSASFTVWLVKPATRTPVPQFCEAPVADCACICTAVPYCALGRCWPAALSEATRTDMVSSSWFSVDGATLRPLLTWQAIQADWL